MNTKLYGIQVSPFSRKVILALEAKGIDYQMEQTSTLNKPDNFEAISPLGKIPAFQDDTLTIADSTVICEYLEDRYPQISLYLDDPALKARVRWFEEYADTVVLSVAGPLFFELVVKKLMKGGEVDQERIDKVLTETMPKVYGYLESQVQEGDYLVGGRLSMADIAIVAHMVNASTVGYPVDSTKWPKLAAYLDDMLSKPLFAQRQQSDAQFMAAMQK